MRKPNKFKIILSFISLLTFSTIAFSTSIISPPIKQNISAADLNITSALIEDIMTRRGVDLNSPIIDLGCNDYGHLSVKLANKGATKIYHVSPCAKKLNLTKNNLPTKLKKEKKVEFINNELSKSEEINKLLKQKSAGFVMGINVLENWSATKTENELTRIYKGLKPGGTVFFTIKNPLATRVLNDKFFKDEYEKENLAMMQENVPNDIIRLNNSTINLFKKIKAQHPDLELLPSSFLHNKVKRLTFYPFEVRKKGKNNQSTEVYQLIFPQNIKAVLYQTGFKNIQVGQVFENKNTFYVAATKY